MQSGVRLTANELADRLGGTIEGDGTREIVEVATLDQATPESLAWIGDEKHLALAGDSNAGIILVNRDCPPVPGRTLIRVADADVALVEILGLLSPPREVPEQGVHPTASVHESATIDGASIGSQVFVGAGAVVGPGTKIHHGAYIGTMTRIGSNCEFWPNVVIRERVTVGDRVILHPNSTIGADGFGYLQRQGTHVKIPQIGSVVIEDDVEIGANSAVDRARTGVTRVGCGTKIDNLVQIGHNVEIGKGCIIVSLCGLGGSCSLGDYVMLGGQVAIVDHKTVGDRVQVAAKSIVCKNIAAGEVVRGIPAIDNSRFLRNEVSARRLPKLIDTVDELSSRVHELEARLAALPGTDRPEGMK